MVEVTYIDLNGEEQTVTATRIVGDETDIESGWYDVVDSVTNSERISNNGNTQDGVNLILCDGAILTNPKGMSVNGGRSLTVWGQSEAYTKAAPLVEKMLQYGAYAKAYFSNTTLDDLDDVMIDAPGTAFDLPDGVTFEGAALSLKSETTLSLYFTSKSTLTFGVNGKTVETVTNGAYQVARIRSIAASELIDSFTVTINGNYSVTYSPMNYCANVLNGGTTDGKLINAVKALYQYSQAANEYFKPYHEGN